MYKFLVVLAFSVTAQLAFAGNYVLTIDNKTYDLSLGEAERIKVGGQYFSVKIEQKNILTYKTENFSFQYSNTAPDRPSYGCRNGCGLKSSLKDLSILAADFSSKAATGCAVCQPHGAALPAHNQPLRPYCSG